MLFTILLLLILSICLITDLKERKIYNVVIFPSLLLTLALHLLIDGLGAFGSALIGFSVGLVILLIPYLLGGMGAGDVKLLALIGAIKGAEFVFETAIYMALIGGVIGIGILLFRKGVFYRLKSIMYSLCGIRYGLKIPLFLDKDVLHTTYPYGVAIVGGAFLSLIIEGWLIPW